MGFLKKHGVTLILLMIALVGLGLISYPMFSDWWNSFHQTRAVMSYAETVANVDAARYDKILNDARAYNEKLAATGVRWTLTEEEEAEYLEELNIDEAGIMGYIDIPKINIKLPIYHGTEESVLQVAIGHIAGSSLPVGGESSHCIISGHRGLPSAKLFTDIDRLTEGDTFSLTVLNDTYTYEVDQIRVVEPTDLSELRIEDGKDYCTLVTCTPYGVNTHRLLVRGHRVDNPNGEASVVADALQIEPIYIAPFVAIPILILLLILMLMSTRRKGGRNGGEKDV